MDAIVDLAPGADANRAVVVMLPGAGDRARDLVQHGFVHALRKRGLVVDARILDAHVGYYLDRDLTRRMEREVIAPLRAAASVRIWLLGISLGGMGALAYLRDHAKTIAGVVLIAPFLGTQGLVAEVERAGGLDEWQPGPIALNDDERQMLAWLRHYRADDPEYPPIFLAYGAEDRLRAASMMLGARLPSDRVLTAPGGHDWVTWRRLWERLLDTYLPLGAVSPRAPEIGEGRA